MSVISSALAFLKHSKGTAVSNGNSSNPSTNFAFLSGASFRQGIFVKAEYRYFMSASNAAFVFSTLAIEGGPPSPNEDHNEDIPDITLRTLDTEWIDKLSEARLFCRDLWVESRRNET